MRDLQTSDVFALARLIKLLELKEELKVLAVNAEEETNLKSLGFDVLFTLINKASEKNCEKAFYDFLAGPFELEPKHIASMDPIQLLENVTKIASIDRWKSFLQLAVR